MADEVPAAFGIAPADVSGAPGLAIRGEVDVSVSRILEQAVDAAIRGSVGAFVLDLCDVAFLDSTGLGVILRARALLARDERELAIVCPPGSARRLFEMAGVTDLLVLYETREDVAAALVPAEPR